MLTVEQVERETKNKARRHYVFITLSFLFTALLLAAAIYFRDEIYHAQAYGYAGVFFVGILCGVTIIPAPTLLMVFTLGGVLNPIYVGLVAGFGGAIGGITVYLTGAGAETIWSRLRSGGQAAGHRTGEGQNPMGQVESKFWTKGEALYNRLVKWIGGKGGSVILFIASAMIISPFYFAGLAAGSLRMGLLRFFLISWAGKTVRYMIIAIAGYWGLRVLLDWIGG